MPCYHSHKPRIVISDLYYADWIEGSCAYIEATGCHVTTLINHALQSVISIILTEYRVMRLH